MLNQFSRTQLLLGKGAMDRLQQAHWILFTAFYAIFM